MTFPADWTQVPVIGQWFDKTGKGTGVPVYYSNGAWRVYSTDSAVSA